MPIGGGVPMKRAAPRKRRRFGQDYTSAAFRPYALALGQLTLAWNDLQESFAALFWTVTCNNEFAFDASELNYAGLHAWHSLRSDRQQKGLLSAWLHGISDDFGRRDFKPELLWLLNKANQLEDDRNNAVHSPLFDSKLSLWVGKTTKERIAPAGWLLNPRAEKLQKKQDLLAEFRRCRDTAMALAYYAHVINDALADARAPWPDRPCLPSRQP